jgi:asparagine synthase (glutamine-hydrolysing)
MDMLCRRLRNSIRSSISEEVCDTVLLSGGLDSTIITAIRKPEYSITVGFGSEASDLKYADLAALKFVRKKIKRILSTNEVLRLIEKVIIALKTFDPITIRNSVVPYAALEVANSNGLECVYTGDGCDELFAGYNFLKRYLDNPQRLENEISRLRAIMTFPTFSLGDSLNVKIIAPFLNAKVVRLAESIPTSDLVGFHRNRLWGKIVLRHCFRDELGEAFCWRKKQAQEEGAGITRIREVILNNNNSFSFVEEARMAKDKGVTIRDMEHLYYFKIFNSNFSLEERRDCPELTCSGCGNCVSFLSNYCQLCGQFPVA